MKEISSIYGQQHLYTMKNNKLMKIDREHAKLLYLYKLCLTSVYDLKKANISNVITDHSKIKIMLPGTRIFTTGVKC